jgi:hypothetical protein
LSIFDCHKQDLSSNNVCYFCSIGRLKGNVTALISVGYFLAFGQLALAKSKQVTRL